jgi:hypothetical protein
MSAQDVINYCVDHYEERGCDIIVETLTDVEIESIIEGAETLEDAIHAVLSWVAPINEYREEIRNTEW